MKKLLILIPSYNEEETILESPDAIGDELIEKKEQAQLIQRAIETLPEKQKKVFLLRYYEEMPYEDIAKILRTSVGGLKANYFHALKKIGDYLKREMQ